MDDKDLAKSGAKTMFKAQQLIRQLESNTKKMSDDMFKQATVVEIKEEEDEEDEL
jgi:hypothetical protein